MADPIYVILRADFFQGAKLTHPEDLVVVKGFEHTHAEAVAEVARLNALHDDGRVRYWWVRKNMPVSVGPSNPRAETGPMIFPDDWRGLFIRGDNALYYTFILSQVLKRTDLNFMERNTLEDLQRLLASAHRDHPEPAQRAELQP